ncbi:hypothetical protein BC939DRAFT_446194 [Gamsiella multidivaricata]|uniref:uncharacterized protein n=1 Tax=Gamsiella multidivaricata TaxID=101098 RepID=UPI00221F4E90|nr:uncharacterized protein BC939DRAFT_446194 [Gamsiella multidivaricata]KAI7826915.1 hypothetical protein BC939DRAFT_446194 [Gamsiella multidivaricata]
MEELSGKKGSSAAPAPNTVSTMPGASPPPTAAPIGSSIASRRSSQSSFSSTSPTLIAASPPRTPPIPVTAPPSSLTSSRDENQPRSSLMGSDLSDSITRGAQERWLSEPNKAYYQDGWCMSQAVTELMPPKYSFKASARSAPRRTEGEGV